MSQPAIADIGSLERESLEEEAQELGRIMQCVLGREASWHPELLLLSERLDAMCDELHQHFERLGAPVRGSPDGGSSDEMLSQVLLELRELVHEDGSPLRHFGLHRLLLREIRAFDQLLAALLADRPAAARNRRLH